MWLFAIYKMFSGTLSLLSSDYVSVLWDLLLQLYLHKSKCWVKCLQREKMWKIGHSAMAGCSASWDTTFIRLIEFFPILSGCFVISLNLNFKKRKKKLKNMFNIFHLSGFPGISSIYYLLASGVKPGCCAVLFHSITSLSLSIPTCLLKNSFIHLSRFTPI